MATSGSTIVPPRPAADAADQEQRRRTRSTSSTTETAAAPVDVVALDLAEDVDGRDLGVERQVPRDQHDRAELADRARERERDAGEDRRQQVREDDAPEDADRPRAEAGGRLLHLAVELEQHGLHGADDERQRHEEQREQRPPPACSATLMLVGPCGP